MTIQNIQLIIDTTTRERKELYNTTRAALVDGSFKLDKNINILHTWFLQNYNIDSRDLDYCSYYYVMSKYNDLIGSTKEHKHKPNFSIELTSWTQYENNEAEIYWTASWVDVISESSLDNAIKKEIRLEVGKIIKPSSVKNSVSVDCKALQMFMENELTYKGLVNSTYGTC